MTDAPRPVAAAVLVVLLALVGLDAAVTEVAERRLARGVGARLCGDATAELSGWPVSLRLLRGTVPHAEVTLRDARPPGTDVVFTRLVLSADDVAVSGGTLTLAGRLGFVAGVDEPDLRRSVELPATVSAVEFRDGEILLRTPVGLAVPAAVTLVEGAVEVRPTAAALDRFAFRIGLDRLPPALDLTAVRVEPGLLVASGTLDPARLPAGAEIDCP